MNALKYEREKKIENNVILAEYVELEIAYHVKKEKVYKYKIVNPDGSSSWYQANELRFHKDWNWMMTVATKIAADERHNVHRYLFNTAVGEADITLAFERVFDVINTFTKSDKEMDFKVNNGLIHKFIHLPGAGATPDYHTDIKKLFNVAYNIIKGYPKFDGYQHMTDLLAAGTTYDINEIYPAVVAFVKMFNENQRVNAQS
jgi:hypothetical protein